MGVMCVGCVWERESQRCVTDGWDVCGMCVGERIRDVCGREKVKDVCGRERVRDVCEMCGMCV